MANNTDRLKQANEFVNRRILLVHHVHMATTAMAYLAFTWSTVVLLGGYVTSLEKKDFWCLTLISLSEATRIFNSLESNEKLMNSVRNFAGNSVQMAVDIAKDCLPISANSKYGNMGGRYSLFRRLATVLYTGILMAPVMAVIFSILILVGLSPFLYVALPTWRLRQHDYGVIGGDSSKASLVPALDIFYSLVLVQGVLTIFTLVIEITQLHVIDALFSLCKFPVGSGRHPVFGYIYDTMAKSEKDVESVEDASLFSYAIELMGTESSDNYVSGVQMLGSFAKQGMENSSELTLLLSREKVQKLILTLGFSGKATGLREYAALILAGFAEDIHLAHFPGAATCISTLLEARGDGSNKLIVQGLAILDKLALDNHNCREIFSTPGLLPKIMAPICSDVLIQDTRITRSRVVTGTFKVLRRLIRVTGKAGRRLRRQISCNKQAVTNLKNIILYQDSQDGAELQMLAMKILLELADDESINLSMETIQKVIKKQLQIFLADEGEEAAAAMHNPRKDMAGKALLVLSSNSKSNSTIIMEAYSDTVNRLIEILDYKNNIWQRISAMKILRNLCKHCASDNELLKEILLRKVLSEILVSKREQQTISPAWGNDEEKQSPKDKHDSRGEKEQSGVKELLEALLSLILQLYDLVDADRFALVAQQKASGDGAFVAKLRDIVEENCEAKQNSQEIVKFCCQIAILMLQRNQYRIHFKDLKFLESVSKASGEMSEAESCRLITDTTALKKKTLRPLLSELENKLKQELGLVR